MDREFLDTRQRNLNLSIVYTTLKAPMAINGISALVICGGLCMNCAGAQLVETSKRQYLERCAGCHGEDGTGGGHGPNIVDVRWPRATSKDAVRDVILKGIPDGGMPAFRVSNEEADAIATFVMSLKTPTAGVMTVSPSVSLIPTTPFCAERTAGGAVLVVPAALLACGLWQSTQVA